LVLGWACVEKGFSRDSGLGTRYIAAIPALREAAMSLPGFPGLFLPLLVVLASCSQAAPVFKVSGKATFRGKPLTTGKVAFHHTDAKSPLVIGDIGPDGTYQLTTRKPGDGAAPGQYTVTVTSMLPGKGVEGIDQDYRPPQPLIPLKYMRLDETPLSASVEAKEQNVIDLNLAP
jgi:hypothetical protein